MMTSQHEADVTRVSRDACHETEAGAELEGEEGAALEGAVATVEGRQVVMVHLTHLEKFWNRNNVSYRAVHFKTR